ncbi:MAG: stage II sporulation protein M [Verrucomicrobiales bacterium]|nr:stage II sporulation protein M [Verrucomicrobiales bacterium]
MILDLDTFLRKERPSWEELARLLDRAESQNSGPATLEEARRLHYLYQRVASDLVKLQTFAGEVPAREHVEQLVARAYSRVHTERKSLGRFAPGKWFFQSVPRSFRSHGKAFALSFCITLLGALFGAGMVSLRPELKQKLIPSQFSHIYQTPSERVAAEQSAQYDPEGKTVFAAMLMSNNIRVTILALALGISFGLFTGIVLFNNGMILGIVCLDYLSDGQGTFLGAWLLPHGSVEIPAILIGGQGGFIIAGVLFGWGTSLGLRQRLARVRSPLLNLIGAAALLLVWAALVEAFLSQYHSPASYPFKIAIGIVQLSALVLWLGWGGRKEIPANF